MFMLPFVCLTCGHKFSTIDEVVVTCPECKKSRVKVDWDNYIKD